MGWPSDWRPQGQLCLFYYPPADPGRKFFLRKTEFDPRSKNTTPPAHQDGAIFSPAQAISAGGRNGSVIGGGVAAVRRTAFRCGEFRSIERPLQPENRPTVQRPPPITDPLPARGNSALAGRLITPGVCAGSRRWRAGSGRGKRRRPAGTRRRNGLAKRTRNHRQPPPSSDPSSPKGAGHDKRGGG